MPVTGLSSWDFRAGGTTEVLSFMSFLSTRRVLASAVRRGSARRRLVGERPATTSRRPQATPPGSASATPTRSQCGPDDPAAVRGGRAAPGAAQPDDGGELVAT